MPDEGTEALGADIANDAFCCSVAAAGIARGVIDLVFVLQTVLRGEVRGKDLAPLLTKLRATKDIMQPHRLLE